MIRLFSTVLILMSSSFVMAAGEKLPLPRFASMRSNKVNTHVGPGATYPVEWTYLKQHLPVEIMAEFDTWRQIRDADGTCGWVHKSLLCGKRTAIIQGKRRKLYKKPDFEAEVVALVDPGVITYLKECKNDWCRVDVKGHVGWLKRRHLWGVYPHEVKF